MRKRENVSKQTKNKKSEMGIRFGKVRLVVCNIENWKTGLCSDNLIFNFFKYVYSTCCQNCMCVIICDEKRLTYVAVLPVTANPPSTFLTCSPP